MATQYESQTEVTSETTRLALDTPTETASAAPATAVAETGWNVPQASDDLSTSTVTDLNCTAYDPD